MGLKQSRQSVQQETKETLKPDVSNLPDGNHKEYNDLKTMLIQKYNVLNGKLNGTHKKWFPDGTLQFECTYVDDKMEGVFRRYTQSGALFQEYNFLNDKVHGKVKKFAGNGRLRIDADFMNGKKHGTCIEYFVKTGKPSRVFNYANGKQDGMCTVYYENGLKKEEIGWKDGKLHGTYRSWDTRGNLLANKEFEMGNQIR